MSAAGRDDMELRSNQRDECHGGARGALPAFENRGTWTVAADLCVTTSKSIDFFPTTDLACDADHIAGPFSAFIFGSVLSLGETASFQPVGREKNLLGWPHAEPIHANSISSVWSVQARRGPRNGLRPAATFLLKTCCGWADESGKGS